jgi:NADPH2:quinone reductase
MSFAEAAAVGDGALLARGCRRRVDLRQGQRLLIDGASGSSGTPAVPLAPYLEAHVTAVRPTKDGATGRALGADAVVDYAREDFTPNGQTYDVIVDAVGKHAFRRCRGSLTRGGAYLPTDRFPNLFWAVWTARIGDTRVVFDLPPRDRTKEVVFLEGLSEAGNDRVVIDRSYQLEQVVDATRSVETEQKTGNVVLTVGHARGT